MSSWLTNGALEYEPKHGVGGGGVVAGSQPMSTVQLYTGAKVNFGDLTPYLTYAIITITVQCTQSQPMLISNEDRKALFFACTFVPISTLKVPKCEIFHLFDFNDFCGIKSV
jgi:hypothetical protein